MKQVLIVIMMSFFWTSASWGNSPLLKAQLDYLNIDSAHYLSEYYIEMVNITVDKRKGYVELTFKTLNSKSDEVLQLPITSTATDACNITTYVAENKNQTEKISVEDNSNSQCSMFKLDPTLASTFVTFSTFTLGKSFPIEKLEQTTSYLSGSPLFPILN